MITKDILEEKFTAVNIKEKTMEEENTNAPTVEEEKRMDEQIKNANSARTIPERVKRSLPSASDQTATQPN